ncbi:MAG: CvpA family protein [Lachnospiraceae bacterium]|nr:CvpA family protein [Lachnospiraceae bacterium]
MNYLLIIILLVFVWRVVSGYKKGMVKELQSFITFIVSSISIALICKAITAYMNAEKINMIIAVLLLIILGTCFKILSLVFFSAKAIVKLPVIHLADKILGIAMGAAEVLFMLWALCLLIDTFQTGLFAKMALAYIKDNNFLKYLYENNLLEKIFEQISQAISSVI